MPILFHTTDAAETILREGFRDGEGSYGLVSSWLQGVFLSDVPASVSDGATGEQVIEVTLPIGLDLSEHEIIEEHKGYREWCIPAAVLNASGILRLLTEDEADDVRWTGRSRETYRPRTQP